jgi:hypothetical protein
VALIRTAYLGFLLVPLIGFCHFAISGAYKKSRFDLLISPTNFFAFFFFFFFFFFFLQMPLRKGNENRPCYSLVQSAVSGDVVFLFEQLSGSREQSNQVLIMRAEAVEAQQPIEVSECFVEARLHNDFIPEARPEFLAPVGVRELGIDDLLALARRHIQEHQKRGHCTHVSGQFEIRHAFKLLSFDSVLLCRCLPRHLVTP